VEHICNQFEATWKQVAGGAPRPSIEAVVTGAAAAGNNLLRELILLDIHYRRQAGETPRAPDYQGRFGGALSVDWLETACLAAVDAAPAALLSPDQETSPTRRFRFLALPEGPDEIGWLGPYRILKVLGEGGMGVVFLAEDSQLRRPVALKVQRPGGGAPLQERMRFLREARAMAALQHDHIITIHQVGQENNVPFLAMQYLEGETLEDRLKREPKPSLYEVLRIGREIAQGLEGAHRHGLVHRDVKPANIWLEAPGDRVKLLDFGLVRPLDDDAHLTPSGYVVGTPGCMAPEQARGEAVDRRTDLFSLGCVLYRMTTGEWPFRGSGSTSQFEALTILDPSPPRVLNPELPAELSDLILQLLAKDPALRPPSAEAAVAHLQSIADEHPSLILTRQVALASQKQTEPAPSGRRAAEALRSEEQPVKRMFALWGWLVVGAMVGVLCILAILAYRIVH
jgi:serine/threonine protein kinase